MMRGGLLQPGQPVAAEHGGVEPGEDVRIDDAGERDPRVAALGQLLDAVPVPGRHEPERLGVGVLDPRPLDVRVEVGDVDEAARPAGRRPRRRRARAAPARSWRRPRPPGPAARSPRRRRARRGPGSGRPRQAIVSAAANSIANDTRARDRPLPRLARRSPSRPDAPTACDLRDFAGWYGENARLERRRRAHAVGVHRRPRPCASGREARAGDDLAAALGGALAAPLLARARAGARDPARAAAGRSACRTRRRRRRSSAALVARPRGARGRQPARAALALRNRALVELVYSAGLRSAEAVGLDLADVDFEQEHVHVRRGKGAQGAGRAARRGGGLLARALPARGAAGARAAAPWTRVFLSARGRRLDTSTLRRLTAAPAPAPPRVRDAPARGRRRPAGDPGAARPRSLSTTQIYSHVDAQTPPPCLRPRPSPILTGAGPRNEVSRCRAATRCSAARRDRRGRLPTPTARAT